MITVEYDSNNSGGSWWLDDEDWIALEEAGWKVHWGGRGLGTNKIPENADAEWAKDNRYMRALAVKASKDFKTMREAVEEWEQITGGDASAAGCYTCCGPPHYFSGTDTETGEHVAGPELVIDSHLEW